jgi:hypothetical protein
LSQAAQPEYFSRGSAGIFDLQALLNPVAAEDFLRRDYGKQYVRVPGYPGKFTSLLPWDVLNDILEEHRLEPPRLRLTREGKSVPPERYLRFQPNRRKSGSPIPRLNSVNLTRELREGATLVLDNVDELHRPVRRMAEALERVFRVRVQVNSYSGWRTSHGFDLHWDDHDVFILQVAGRKHWQVYGMTRQFPLAVDAEPTAVPPTEVLWEGLLEDGDLLYIPRGWWHVATPMDEPTLHLTVGVNNPTGADFLSWFVQKLRASETVRQDLPHLDGPDAMAAHAQRLQAALADAWKPDLLDEYMNHLDLSSRARPSFALPWTAMPGVLPDTTEFRVRWAGARAATIDSEVAGAITIASLGRRWRFAEAARPVLGALLSGSSASFAQLVSIGAASGLDESTVRAFMRELITNGLVTVDAV